VEEKEPMMKMHHPFIIKLFQTLSRRAFCIYAAGACSGWWLFSVSRQAFVCLPGRVKFYMAIADALAYMHRSKYVFRDLKPENVMIDRFGYPVVIDFGFAKYVPERHTHCVVVSFAVSLFVVCCS
jgi:serine/threonine protein kinase